MNKNGIVTPIVEGRKRPKPAEDIVGYAIYNKGSGQPIQHILKSYRNGEGLQMPVIPIFLTDWEARRYLDRDALYRHTSYIKSIKILGDDKPKSKRQYRKRVQLSTN